MVKEGYQEAAAYIGELPKFTVKHPLDHVREFVRYLGEPGVDGKIIHVAGTNGKGSVCAYIQAILSGEGRKTGLFTSPHLVRLNERIRIGDQDISDAEFVRVFTRVKTAALQMEADGWGHPSYFEFLFAMAMCAFSEAKVEYIILETGLGGRLDATNVVPRPLVTIITALGYDHTDLLGDTIAAIAAEKAGIIKPGVPVVCDGNDREAAAVIRNRAAELGCVCREIAKNAYEIKKITSKYIDFSILSAYYGGIAWTLNGGGSYQPMNAVLALEAMRIIAGDEAFKQPMAGWAEALAKVTWPGRMEEVLPGVILDGGHNMQAIREITDTINRQSEDRQCLILYAAVADKKYIEAAGYLAEHIEADCFITATLQDQRGVRGEELADIISGRTGCKVAVKENVREAFAYALQKKAPDGRLYCLGSLYLIGEIKQLLEEE